MYLLSIMIQRKPTFSPDTMVQFTFPNFFFSCHIFTFFLYIQNKTWAGGETYYIPEIFWGEVNCYWWGIEESLCYSEQVGMANALDFDAHLPKKKLCKDTHIGRAVNFNFGASIVASTMACDRKWHSTCKYGFPSTKNLWKDTNMSHALCFEVWPPILTFKWE